MPIGGKLVLKGGETLGGAVQKKKKKKKSKKGDEEGADPEAAAAGEGEQQEGGEGAAVGAAKTGAKVDAQGITTKGSTYEQEFDIEMSRLKQGKVRSTAWGCTYRAPPEILHGYDRKVTGQTASERLDMRSAAKSDKFSK
ncbi:MAG: hypothetical protein J3K34DRAFT_523565 [Monoraphidium minutum]|nr:MAG: hypothetical protein J3K34DRAFT_523565 [Monoraphidium minutum]